MEETFDHFARSLKSFEEWKKSRTAIGEKGPGSRSDHAGILLAKKGKREYNYLLF